MGWLGGGGGLDLFERERSTCQYFVGFLRWLDFSKVSFHFWREYCVKVFWIWEFRIGMRGSEGF